MKTFKQIREGRLREGAYVGGKEHTWPQWIGGINSAKSTAIRVALIKAGYHFNDNGSVPAGIKNNTHTISNLSMQGYNELQKLKKKYGLPKNSYGTPGWEKMKDHKGKAAKEDLPKHVKHDPNADYMK